MKVTLKIHPKSPEDIIKLVRVLQFLQEPGTKEEETPKQKPIEAPKPSTPPPPPPTKKPASSPAPAVAAKPPVKAAEPIEEAEVVDEEPATTAHTDDSLRALTQTKIKAGHRDAVAATLAKFKATNVSTLKPEHYNAYHDELSKLK